jgi:hypothetical protein
MESGMGREMERDVESGMERVESRMDRGRNRCDKCVCNILRNLKRGTEVDVFLFGGRVFEDVIFRDFDPNNCCATFRDEEVEKGTTIFVDCRDIEALRVE